MFLRHGIEYSMVLMNKRMESEFTNYSIKLIC